MTQARRTIRRQCACSPRRSVGRSVNQQAGVPRPNVSVYRRRVFLCVCACDDSGHLLFCFRKQCGISILPSATSWRTRSITLATLHVVVDGTFTSGGKGGGRGVEQWSRVSKRADGWAFCSLPLNRTRLWQGNRMPETIANTTPAHALFLPFA